MTYPEIKYAYVKCLSETVDTNYFQLVIFR